ncbi:MAG TPA: hypothetical protein ENK43_04230 [Planctomycetes bacterium]|nr:hypothetical protein [Planctomycetota bacterium]
MKTTLALLLVFALPLGLAAQEGDGPWQKLSKQFDKDKDGKITMDELGRGKTSFERLDRNGDGVVTAKDFQRRGRRGMGMSPAEMKKMFVGMTLPGDKDGKITRQAWDEFVASCDADKNGVCTNDELKEAGIPSRRVRFMKRILDANDDGKIQKEEVAGIFAELDKDKSGDLGKNEVTRFRNRRGGRRRRGDRASRQGPKLPQEGEVAPDFDLPVLGDKSKTIKLSSFAGKKPVALIFGSYT